MTGIITLPEIPTRQLCIDNEQFFTALNAWQNVCRQVVQRTAYVQPAPMPRRDGYLTGEQYLIALAAWEGVFCPPERVERPDPGVFRLKGARFE